MKQIYKLRETKSSKSVQTKSQCSQSHMFPKSKSQSQVSYGEKSLRCYRSKIWNSLPFHVKTGEKLKTFEDIIKNWNGSTCNCRVCQS